MNEIRVQHEIAMKPKVNLSKSFIIFPLFVFSC